MKSALFSAKIAGFFLFFGLLALTFDENLINRLMSSFFLSNMLYFSLDAIICAIDSKK